MADTTPTTRKRQSSDRPAHETVIDIRLTPAAVAFLGVAALLPLVAGGVLALLRTQQSPANSPAPRVQATQAVPTVDRTAGQLPSIEPLPTAVDLPEVVARVNGVQITRDELERGANLRAVLLLLQEGKLVSNEPQAQAAFRREVLDELIDYELIVQAAAKKGMSVDDDQVRTERAKLGPSQGITTADFEERVKRLGLTDEHIDDWVRGSLIVTRYSVEYLSQAGPVTDPERAIQQHARELQDQGEVLLYYGQQSVSVAQVGKPAPDFSLQGLDGSPVTLSQFRGRPVLLNFWATWCPPCRFEMPLFQSTYEKLGDDGLVILAVDVSEPADKVQAYVNQMKLTFPVALDSDGKVSSLFRVRGLPTSFFIDVGGVIVDMNRGGVTQATLAPRLSLLGLGQAAEGG